MTLLRPGFGDTANRHHLWLRYLLVTSVIVALVISLASVAFWQEKHRYRERATSAAQNFSSLLDQQISDVFSKIDVVLLSCAYAYRSEAASGPIDPGRLNAYLSHQESLVPELDGLRILDKEGFVRFGRGVPASDPVNLSDREMFIRAHDRGEMGLIIYGPVFAQITKKWVIALARRLEAPDGSFSGVVYANLTTEHFDKILSLATVGPHGAATIRTAELALVHRFPTTQNAVGSKEVSKQLREAVQTSPEGGEYIATTTLDGIERSNAFRKLRGAPFYVIVGLATDDYLGGWRQNVQLVSGLAGLAVLITVLAATLVYRAHLRLRNDIENRIRLSGELEQAVAERSNLNAELKVRAHELEQMNATLEQMVHERTAELTQANLELEQIARCDTLTGLGNRLFADEHLREEFLRMKRTGEVFSVLLIDIDRFKRVNDTYGHEVGDLVLKHIARILSDSVRVTDFVARFGGEEFLVILPNTTQENAVLVAEKIRVSAEEAIVPTVSHFTLSVGVAMANVENAAKEDVVRLADQCLYQAKSMGRNRVGAQNPG